MGKNKFVFVDGYNVINQWDELKKIKDTNLDYARDKLIDMLQEYVAVKGVKLFVVFDAHLQKGGVEKRIKVGNIDVIFTKEGETADCFIERNVYIHAKKGEVAVVTSDYLEQRIALQMGGVRITPNELLWEVNSLKKHISQKSKISYKEEKNTLADVLQKDILEKLEKMRRNH